MQPTAQVTRTIDAPAAKVWKALTTPATIKTYFMGADEESDWREGAPIRWRGEVKGKPYEDHGEIRTFDPGRRLAFSHFSPLSGAPDRPENYHLVSFDLTPQGDATRVTLSQSNLSGEAKPSDAEHRAEYEKTWAMVLEGLGKAVEG